MKSPRILPRRSAVGELARQIYGLQHQDNENDGDVRGKKLKWYHIRDYDKCECYARTKHIRSKNRNANFIPAKFKWMNQNQPFHSPPRFLVPHKWGGPGLLGATIKYDTFDKDSIRVTRVFPNSPAEKGGIKEWGNLYSFITVFIYFEQMKWHTMH
jgi:hypothetical protein